MFLNEAARWSRISRFGNSNLARLTIVTPFLGFLVFLNVGLEEYVKLGPVELTDGWLKYFSDRRIEFLYVGLTILGSAIGLYSVLAPEIIKDSTQYSEYIAFQEDTKTRNAVIGSLEATLQHCWQLKEDGQGSFYDIPASRSCPTKILDAVYRLITEVFEQSEEIYVRRSEQEVDKGDDDHSEPSSHYMYNAMPDVDAIFESVVMRRRVEWGMWKGFYIEAENYSIDVFRLKYLLNDYSLPVVRASIFGVICLGAVVTLVPTVISILLVLLYAF